MKLTDLKDLRIIKKSLEPQPEPKPQQNQPRKRSVVLKSAAALRKELDEVFALSCTYTYSTPGISDCRTLMLRCVVTKRKCTFHQKDQGPQIQSYGNNNLNHDSSVLRMQSYIALVPNYCARLGIWKKFLPGEH